MSRNRTDTGIIRVRCVTNTYVSVMQYDWIVRGLKVVAVFGALWWLLAKRYQLWSAVMRIRSWSSSSPPPPPPLWSIVSRRRSPSLATNSESTDVIHDVQPASVITAFATSVRACPGPGKIKTEDAVIVTQDPNRCSQKLLVAVADGVGGWATVGIDAGHYARELLAGVQAAYVTANLNDADPKHLLQQAYNSLAVSTQGSCTACVTVFEGGLLKVCNLGDSGVIGYRRGRIFVRTDEQQHYFNCPFQLGSEGEDTISDHPDAAISFVVPIEPLDIVVLASDGLFDNLSDHRIITIIHQHVEHYGRTQNGQLSQKALDVLASRLVEEANVCAKSSMVTPFGCKALQSGQRHVGGKPDDVTVVCVQACVSRMT